ncbi:MAG: hypothetical protein ACRDH9_04975 [Actinomycetota bacterium]
MPGRNDYALVARELKRRLNGKAFLTIGRRKVTEILREVSDEPTTRIKSVVARDLTHILLEQGLRCYPSLEETNTFETIRIFRAGSVFGNLVDLIIHPSSETDHDVGAMLKKVKGTWNWSTPTPGAVETLPGDE